MDTRPLVSVVLPAFNRAAAFRRTLESVLGQKYRNLEVIVADDASTDDIRGVVAEFGDGRIAYRRNPERRGVTATKVEAFKNARGEFVASAHDNHAWGEDLLETLVPILLEHPEAVLAFSDHFVVNDCGEIEPKATDENSRLWKRDSLAPGIHKPFFQAAIIDRSIPVTHAMVLRRNAVDWSDFPDLSACHDVWLNYLACRAGGAAYYSPKRLTRYNFFSNPGISPTRYQAASSLVVCYDRMLRDGRLRELRPQIAAMLGNAHASTGIELLRGGRFREARHHLFNSLKRTPGIRVALLALGSSVAPGLLRSRLLARHAPAE